MKNEKNVNLLFVVFSTSLFTASSVIPTATAKVTNYTTLPNSQVNIAESNNVLPQVIHGSKERTIAQSTNTTNVQNALVQLRTFIPCQAIDPIPGISIGSIFSGDNRDFTNKFTTQVRSLQQASVVITNSQVNTVKSPIYFGQTKRYDENQGFRNQEDPLWCWQLKANQSPVALTRQRSTDKNNKTVINRVGEAVQVIFYLNGQIPSTSRPEELVSPFVPAFTADISILIRPRKDGGLEYQVLGTHDGFPAYELLINNNLVYTHSPLITGETPASLAPPSEKRVSIPWRKVPPSPL